MIPCVASGYQLLGDNRTVEDTFEIRSLGDSFSKCPYCLQLPMCLQLPESGNRIVSNYRIVSKCPVCLQVGGMSATAQLSPTAQMGSRYVFKCPIRLQMPKMGPRNLPPSRASFINFYSTI